MFLYCPARSAVGEEALVHSAEQYLFAFGGNAHHTRGLLEVHEDEQEYLRTGKHRSESRVEAQRSVDLLR